MFSPQVAGFLTILGGGVKGGVFFHPKEGIVGGGGLLLV